MTDPLVELVSKALSTPDPLPFAFVEGQRVRVCKDVVNDGQTPKFWAGAVVTIERAYGTVLVKSHWYRLRHDSGASDEFKEDELDRRYMRRLRKRELTKAQKDILAKAFEKA